MAGNPKNYALYPESQAFVDATANPPFLNELPPAEGRKAVNSVQDSPIFKPDIDTRKCKGDCPDCITACHREYNVPEKHNPNFKAPGPKPSQESGARRHSVG